MSKSGKKIAKKRVSLPRVSEYSKTFLSDWTRLSRTGRFNMGKLKEVMMLLIANDESLGAEWKDHELKGNWGGYRELHVGGDFLLIYKIEPFPKYEVVYFVRIGTHSELFK